MPGISRETFEKMDQDAKLNVIFDLLTNHLAHHERVLRFVIFPAAVGIGILITDKAISLIAAIVGHIR